MASGVQVTGLRELIRDLQRLGLEIEDLKDALGKISSKAADIAESLAPRRSGALADSVRGNRAKAKAVVTAGRGKTNAYAGVQNYGAPNRNIPATLFMQRADWQVRPMVVPALTADIDRLIAAKGLR